ncbi:MAG: DMT family transporter [Rhodothermales bacterium]|nr:DMT family transporter [Rhodothermales bacterium]
MSLDRASPRPTHDLALLVVVLVWGINFPILKHAVTVMHPFALNVFRFLISTLTMGAIVWSRSGGGRVGIWELFRRHALRIVVLGLIGTLLYQWFFILGIARTTAGTAALIMASAPAWTVLVGHLRGYESTSRITILGLAASLGGTALIVFAGHDRISFGNETLAGNVLILGASMMWGTYTALARPTIRYIPPLELSFVGLLVAMPFLLLLGAPHLGSILWADVTPGIWLSILYSGALSTGLAVVVWNVSVKHAGANYTALFGNLVPIVALATGAIFLDEPITRIQLVGGAMAIGGVVLMRLHGARAASRSRDEPPE